MKIKVHTEPFHYITIENLWTKKERKEMFDEMVHFESKGLFLDPEDTATAKHGVTGESLKKNKAKFFDNIYSEREYSSVLSHNKKLFDIFEDKEIDKSWYYKNLEFSEYRTLISYYEDTDYYKSHRDDVLITALSYFFVEPKKFKGGEIIFTDFNLRFEVTNNTTIVFPSHIMHEVSEISLDEKDKGKGLGRFCMNQFVSWYGNS